MDRVYNTLTSTQHIRILTLAPSEDGDAALQGSLDQQRIDDQSQEYEAISYTWGDQGRSHTLRCNDTMIKITPNLASALCCLRSRTTPRRLWADAICINQDDLNEKGQQIPLMARIFRYATEVRVWLGKGEGGESEALDHLASFARRAKPFENRDHEPEGNQALVDVGRSAKKIFRMPWFGRRWIVQELVLNGNVMFHCGQSKVSWPALNFVFHVLPTGIWVDELDIHLRRKLAQFANLWRAWCFGDASTIDYGIYSLLNSFADLQCKDAKDRIYAIAGLADDIELHSSPSAGSVASVTPNYGTSDKEVFRDLAFKMIKSGKVFSTLVHAGASRVAGAKKSLGSWIPDVWHIGSCPMLATDRDADFKIVGVWEPFNGCLALEIEVYDWSFMKPRLKIRDSVDIMRYWNQLYVEDVFQAPTIWITRDGYGLPEHIHDWLRDSCDSYVTFDIVADIVCSLIRCQLVTENGHESFDWLPDIARLQKQLADYSPLDSQWATYLNKALSTQKIYVAKYLLHAGVRELPENVIHFFGFGPHDLIPSDAILLPSKNKRNAPALFLRPTATKYRVIGGGLLWAWPEDYIRFVPREIEVHLI